MEREIQSLTKSESRGGAGWDGISNLKEDKLNCACIIFVFFRFYRWILDTSIFKLIT